MVSRKEWDSLADDFEREVCDITRENNGKEIARLVLGLRPSPGKSVLVDLGCGIGTFVERYSRLFRATFAVEHAPRIIARAKKRLASRSGITRRNSRVCSQKVSGIGRWKPPTSMIFVVRRAPQ